MSQWKYANDELTVVYRINSDGSCESCLVSTPQIQEYLAQGNEILPKDDQ